METLFNNSLELDYEIFYTLNLKKEFTDEYKNIFNYNLDSLEKLKDSFDFENFSFENFYQLLKLFDECDTQRKNFRTLALKFMRDRLSMDNLMKEDENLILNKMKILAEMKEKVIEHQYNKMNEFNLENKILKEELQKIKNEYNAIKNNLQMNSKNNKAANSNLIITKSLNINNNINNASNLNETKRKILKKTKLPAKITNTVTKTNNLSLNNMNNYNNSKDLNHSNANNSLSSKNSIINKSSEILNATFRKSNFNDDTTTFNNNNIQISNITKSNINRTNKKNINTNNSNNCSTNASNIQDIIAGSSKKNELRSNSKIIYNHRKNNSLCDKSLDLNILLGSPSRKANESAECAMSPKNKETNKQTVNKSNISGMNITMKVNNINNFNSNIHANIISNSAGSLNNNNNKEFLEAQSNLINFSNLNTNTNLLNDSFNNNTNDNLLKKMLNLDFLGEKCNIISNSPINSPKIKFSTVQTENSVNNHSGGATQVSFNMNSLDLNNINNNNNDKFIYKAARVHRNLNNRNDLLLNNINNHLNSSGGNKNSDLINSDNSMQKHFTQNSKYTNSNCKSTKFNIENSDKLITKEINYMNNNNNINFNNLSNNFDENTLFNPECQSNSINSQGEFNRNAQYQINPKSLKNLNNKEISSETMISNNKIAKTNYNKNNTNLNECKSVEKNKRENSQEDYHENKNSPCFMREGAPVQNQFVNSNCFGYTHKFNEYQLIPNHHTCKSSKGILKNEEFLDDESESNNYDNKKKKFKFDCVIAQEIFEDEKPKDLEYTKTERYSSSIPRKSVLKGKYFSNKLEENAEDEKNKNPKNHENSKITNKMRIEKNKFNTNLKFKNESTFTPKNSAINNNTNFNSDIKKALTPRKNNLTQKNSFNASKDLLNNISNNLNKQNKKLNSDNSPTKLRKGHSNSIDFDQNALINLSNSQYQSNFANYNTSIKKRRQKQNSEIYDSENLNTHASWRKPKLDISDLTYQSTINKTDLYEYAPDAENFQANTNRNLINPKKLIFVEKISENNFNKQTNACKDLTDFSNIDNNNINYNINNTNNDSRQINFNYNNKNNTKNEYISDSNENKKINVNKINNKNTRNSALNNNCSINSTKYEEQTNRNPNDNNNLAGIITVFNCNFKNETKKAHKLNNNSVNLCHPNFKESRLAMELLSKRSTPSNNSSNLNAGGSLGFSRNNDNNNYNLRLNATLNSINELKKKMNL